MFYGDRFIFDGTPCESYNLILYNVGSATQGQTSFTTGSEFVEDRIYRRYDPLYYNASQNEPLKFTLVFGLHPYAVNEGVVIDRWDAERIASWLTGVDGYRWLSILGDDLEDVQYRCKISDLRFVESGMYKQVMQCTVTCDSPFGYLREMVFDFDGSDSGNTVTLKSRSTYNGIYYPTVEIELQGESSVKIENQSTGETMQFENIPAAYQGSTLYIDNQNQIVRMSTGDNPYPYFNKKFLGLRRGDNTIVITGSCAVRFRCVFPVNVGG